MTYTKPIKMTVQKLIRVLQTCPKDYIVSKAYLDKTENIGVVRIWDDLKIVHLTAE